MPPDHPRGAVPALQRVLLVEGALDDQPPFSRPWILVIAARRLDCAGQSALDLIALKQHRGMPPQFYLSHPNKSPVCPPFPQYGQDRRGLNGSRYLSIDVTVDFLSSSSSPGAEQDVFPVQPRTNQPPKHQYRAGVRILRHPAPMPASAFPASKLTAAGVSIGTFLLHRK